MANAAESGPAESKPPQPEVKGAFVSVDGVRFPKVFENTRSMAEQIECIRALELREDDVILCAIAKAGTHWLWEVGSMLMAGKAEYEKNVKEHVMLEASDIDRVQQQPSPRLLNTHVPVSMLPRQVKDKKVKVIHVYRNVKDVCVSMYFHLKQRDPMPIEEFFEKRFLNFEGNENGNYFAYLKSMDEFIKANPDHPIFNVSFEEMKTDPVGTVTRLAEFLGVPHTPELCRQVADACTIDKMREADKSKDRSVLQKRKFGQGMNISMYRKGEVGDWKNHLTVAQSERLDALMKQLEGCDFRFRYTL